MNANRRFSYVFLTALHLLVGCKNVHFKSGSFDAAGFDRDGGAAGSGAKSDGGSKPAKKPDAGGGTSKADEDGGASPDAMVADAGPKPSSPDSWPTDLAKATCDALMDCYGNADLLTDTLGGRDCVTLNENLLRGGQLRYLPDSVKAGLVQYQASALPTCLKDIRALGCNVRQSRLPASCRQALVGKKLTADNCTIDLDCQADAFCDKGMLATCPGVCASLQGEDLPCNGADDAQCVDGLICFKGTCKPLGEEGQTCSDTLPKCKPGLVCNVQGSTQTCQTIATVYAKKEGDTCDPVSALCAPGLVCESVDASSGKCAQPVAADAECKRGQPDPCPVSQYCDATAPGVTGMCRDRPSAGQACLAANRAPRCAPDSICVASTCQKLQQIGGDCTDAAECYSGSCGSSGTCEGPLMCAPP